ncbi:sigma 54-interacting transcriptional regulator [Oscillibacter sp. MSJ-2]|uniref:Sigma 54-interacting transcriptional regulator n=1 Tax=Dysosmobacter acutus TaxID=2841504 RepID=A0ABS6F6J0_9FIRM|nr:sigma 54-interacting transcriptional regulator [Dysosmobacter acutus]MBU5625678.1 sigma 54-interacting transcriptional regulator [Dysosmobacter acutus]
MLKFEDYAMSNVDVLQVVDRNYRIVFNSRFESAFGTVEPGYHPEDYLGRNFFEVYPGISRNHSSIVRTMSTGKVTVRRRQRYTDYKGRSFLSDNVTIPIMSRGKILGVFELNKDITTIKDLEAQGDPDDQNPEQITFDSILTQNAVMRENIHRAKMFATNKAPIFIYGETGTGKELFAQAIIHACNVPYSKVVAHNCASVPEALMESALFGSVKGAYTGAENRKGLFEAANGGILFLDEFNSMPYSVQGKLLRVLQDGSFRPLGSNTEKKVDVKVIAAMNEDPMEAIRQKKLRSDLFYRLGANMIKLIPLRERGEDIQWFTSYYIQQFSQLYHKNVTGLTAELQDLFLQYSWNGNIREMKNVIDSMVNICDGDTLSTDHLPIYLYDILQDYRVRKVWQEDLDQLVSRRIEVPRAAVSPAPAPLPDLTDGAEECLDLNLALKRTERELIGRALQLAKGNKTAAAALLRIPRQTLNYKLSQLKEVPEL